jgi:DNA-binding response OmpR family regulator
MTSCNLLLVEDDEVVSRTIERSLRGNEFQVIKAMSGVEGLKLARQIMPDIVILDVIMPGMDGYTVCKEMRADPLLNKIPILFLTAKIKDEDRINGFRSGADDYLCKPFNIEELILRIRAITRRSKLQEPLDKSEAVGQQPGQEFPDNVQSLLEKINKGAKAVEANRCLIVGNYLLDTRTHILHTQHRGGLLLTPVQYDLLYHLMIHPGEVFSPARLLDEVWDYPAQTGSTDLVRVHIRNLRERIEVEPSSPKFIRTVPGYGYTINPSVEI